jgi:hypothetical protein
MNNIFDRIVYTKKDRELTEVMSTIPNLSTYLDSRPNIVTFVNLSNISLQFSTSSLPFNGPYFPAGPETLNLNIRDGGYF